MADVLISDLSSAGALADANLVEVEQGVSPSNTSGKVTLATLLAYFSRRKVTALVTVAGTPNTATADLAGGANRDFTLALSANVTLAVSNLPAAGYVCEIEVQVKQPASGGPYTLTLPASFKPLGGSDTTIATAANAVTVLSAKSWDQGTTWRYAMQESA